MTPDTRPSAVVIGAGLAGLAAADALVRRNAHVTVLAPGNRVGGVIGTIRRDGWLVERSADCFLAARPEVGVLAERLGLSDELIGVDPVARRALVWNEGRPVPIPAGFRLMAPSRAWPLIMSPLLTVPGWVRLLWERFVPATPASPDTDESLESFAVRRLGREAFERIVQPLAAGIWTADPARLSMAAACPEFLAFEREAGSLWAGERARLRARPAADDAAGARYGQFLTFRSGMETLPRRLADDLERRGVRFVAASATALSRPASGGWRIAITDSATSLAADAVVMATPATESARLLAGLDPALAAELAAIEYAGSCIVSLGFKRDRVAHRLDAAGLVIPRVAGRRVLAVSFASSKFPNRAPPGCVLLRVFVGGALDPEALLLTDDALVDRARVEVEQLLGTRGQPMLAHVERWQSSMPQYHLGHVSRADRIDAAIGRHVGLALAGAAYTGVGIPQVIASGHTAASRVSNDHEPTPR